MTATAKPTTPHHAKAGASPADVIRRAREAGVQVVDLRFTDLPGTWQHFSTPLAELTEDLFAEGISTAGTHRAKHNVSHSPRQPEGYFPVPHTNQLQELRSKIILATIAAGIDVEVHHQEAGTAGQTEIYMRFKALTPMADQMM